MPAMDELQDLPPSRLTASSAPKVIISRPARRGETRVDTRRAAVAAHGEQLPASSGQGAAGAGRRRCRSRTAPAPAENPFAIVIADDGAVGHQSIGPAVTRSPPGMSGSLPRAASRTAAAEVDRRPPRAPGRVDRLVLGLACRRPTPGRAGGMGRAGRSGRRAPRCPSCVHQTSSRRGSGKHDSGSCRRERIADEIDRRLVPVPQPRTRQFVGDAVLGTCGPHLRPAAYETGGGAWPRRSSLASSAGPTPHGPWAHPGRRRT